MRRTAKSLFRFANIDHICYLPRIIAQIQNWPEYLIDYFGMRGSTRRFMFRNGLILYADEFDASGIIAVVFIRRHYGAFSGKSVIVDIGANIGVFALYAASIDGEARIICYEPMTDNYNLLRKNIEVNGLNSRIQTQCIAIAGQRGTREMHVAASTIHSFVLNEERTQRKTVPCIMLCDILEANNLEEIDLLKMNCEGAEYEILYSSSDDTLRRIKEIRMEYHNADGTERNLDSVIRYLVSHDYRITHLWKYKHTDGFIWASR